MKQVEKKLCHDIAKMKGNILAIGVTEEPLKQAIETNKNITKAQYLNRVEDGEKKGFFSFQKQVSAKKIRRKFKKKKTDYIICKMSEIESFKKRFLRDTIYLVREKIYFYGEKKEDIQEYLNLYKRYQADITIENLEKYYIAIVNVQKSKYHWWKDIWYRLIDGMILIYEYTGDLFIH